MTNTTVWAQALGPRKRSPVGRRASLSRSAYSPRQHPSPVTEALCKCLDSRAGRSQSPSPASWGWSQGGAGGRGDDAVITAAGSWEAAEPAFGGLSLPRTLALTPELGWISLNFQFPSHIISSVQSLSHVWLFATPMRGCVCVRAPCFKVKLISRTVVSNSLQPHEL